MPLNLSNRDQNSGHLFYNRRLKAAITRFSVRMKHDDRKQQAAVALSIVFVLIGIGWMALLHVMKPAGLVGQSAIIGNRDTGAIYAKIDGRLVELSLHPTVMSGYTHGELADRLNLAIAALREEAEAENQARYGGALQ